MIWIVFAFVLIFITGLIINIKGLKNLKGEYDFIIEYRNKFIELANQFNSSQSLDNGLYLWLVSKSIKAQNILGRLGVVHYTGSYLRPYSVPNYEMISNTIPQIRMGSVHQNELLTCEDLMVRFLGHQEELIQKSFKNLKNPIIWFQLGIQFYLAFPLHLLNWFGIISAKFINSTLSSWFYKLISGIVGLIAFISGLITIAIGWNEFLDLVKRLLNGSN